VFDSDVERVLHVGVAGIGEDRAVPQCPRAILRIAGEARQGMEAVRQMKCADGKEDAIELSLLEALANAVVHGAKEDPNKVIECLVATDDQRGILIIVRDPGSGFDPNAIPACTVGENLFSNHGRGIFLINQLMDEVQFHKNGTEIHMVKR